MAAGVGCGGGGAGAQGHHSEVHVWSDHQTRSAPKPTFALDSSPGRARTFPLGDIWGADDPPQVFGSEGTSRAAACTGRSKAQASWLQRKDLLLQWPGCLPPDTPHGPCGGELGWHVRPIEREPPGSPAP